MSAESVPVEAYLEPSSERKPVHSSQDRLLPPPLAQPHEASRRVVHHGRLRRGLWPSTRRVLFRQVLSGAERLLTGAGDDGNEQRRLFIEPGKEIVPVPMSLRRQ